MTIAISIAAFVVSAATFSTSYWRDRRDLMLRVHQNLTTIEQQRGRRAIHRMSDQHKRVEDLTPDEYDLINNALAALDLMAVYYRRRYIPREPMLEFWAEPVLRHMRAAEPFLIHRDRDWIATTGRRTWPALHAFADDARRYVERHGLQASAPRKPDVGPADEPAEG
jgi:hypothetical protein